MNAKKIIKKTLKILACTIGVLVVLVAVALWAVVWIISPENLTRYAEQAANEYLNAKVEIGRLELTAYSTFPILHIDIDSLSIESGSFDSAQGIDLSALPANASQLASLTKLHFSLNLAEAMVGRVDVKDLSVTDLNVNIVEATPVINNYTIVPLDDVEEDTTVADTSLMELPWMRCKQIRLEGTTRLSYYSAIDTMSATVELSEASIMATGRDKYVFRLAGMADFSAGGRPVVTELPFSINTDIGWNYRRMMDIKLTDLRAALLDIPISGNVTLLAEGVNPILHDFDIKIDSVRFSSILPQLPEEYRYMFNRVQSNLMASIEAGLNEPYELTSDKLPSMSARLIIPDSYWQSVGGRGRIDRFALDAQMELDGNKPNSSVVTLNDLVINGAAVKLQLSGRATNLFADPCVTATLNGNTDLGIIMSMVNVPLDFTVTGEAEVNASVDMAMSDLSKENLHKVKLTGSLGLRNLKYDNVLDTIIVSFNQAIVSFGNQETYVRRDSTMGDDLLKVTVNIDTLDANIPGIDVSLKNLHIGAGVVGAWQASQDSTQVIPMGLNVTAGRLRMKQADGTFLASRGLSCTGTVSRFRNMSRMPVFYLGLGLDTLFYRDNSQFVYLKDSKIDLVASRRVNMRRLNRTRRLIDTLRVAHPDWSNDSLLAVVREIQQKQQAERRSRHAERNVSQFDDSEVMDLSVDSGFARLLAQWQLNGRIKSNTGAMYTPYFPLRNRITDVDIKFNTDSLTVENFNYHVGNSNFSMKGKLKNIRSTMLGRTRNPLDISMIVKADSIDVNQLVKAATDGMIYSDGEVGLNALPNDSETIDIDQMQQQVYDLQDDDTTMSAFVVPRNIEAKIAVRSNNITFADMNFNEFNGNLFIHDGVINLNELSATSDIGSAQFNAMYASTDKRNIKFGMDLGLKKIKVKEFLNMIPAIDSVMPLLRSVDGIIDADLAATANLDSVMDIDIPSLRAALKLHGDSLVFMDAETFNKIAKMLRFKNRERNMIDQMTVEMLVENSQMMLYPFMFDVDRYRLGVLGYNDLNLNFRYHISVLKSPIPFKFGINIYGNPDDMHFRFGGAKYKEDDLKAQMVEIVDTTRINLREQINSALRRGADAALRSELRVNGRRPDMRNMVDDAEKDELTPADSVQLMQEGLIERQDVALPLDDVSSDDTDDGGRENGDDTSHTQSAIKPDDD